ncbi:unnamed protein product [Schistosoma turkestanicum]|nr:unnamed protein product [Schistosoma turkestanicum]
MHYLEHDSKTTNSHHSDCSSKRHSTLEKILLRQEEAKARRELRQKELESRRLREANDRQMKAQILYKAKQDEKLRQAEEKREEELIHQEMVRVRKELELEKQASIKNKNSQIENKSFASPKNPVPQLDLTFLSEDSVDESESFTVTANVECEQIKREKDLMKRTFHAWYNLIYNINILFTMLHAKNEFHLKKTYFNQWKLKIHQIHYYREIEQVKMNSIEFIKKEFHAKKYHERFLLKQCFTRWICTIRIDKSTRNQLEKESLRREKEIEFLNHLETFINTEPTTTCTSDDIHENTESIPSHSSRKCLTDRKPKQSKIGCTRKTRLKSTNSIASVDDLISDNCITDQNKTNRKANRIRSTQSDVMKPIFNQKLMQLRHIINAQHREINELKAAQRYSEWLLQAKAQKLAKNMLENTNTKPTETDKLSFIESPQLIIDDENGTDDQVPSQIISNEINDPIIQESNNLPMTNPPVTSTPLKNVPTAKKCSFTQKMEERAAERARRRAIQAERRNEIEQKKKEQLAKQLEEEANRIKEEKRMLKEKKIREEELRQQKEFQLAKQRELNSKISAHRIIACLRYYGLKPWINYIVQQHEFIRIADCYQKKMIMRNSFHTWLLNLKVKYQQQTEFVQHHYHLLLMKRTIKAFQMACEISKRNEAYADEWYHGKLLRHCFSFWSQYITDQCIREWELEDIALGHYNRHLLYIYFKLWTHYPTIQRVQRDREYRREQFRKCILDIIPDFNPPPEQDVSEMD